MCRGCVLATRSQQPARPDREQLRRTSPPRGVSRRHHRSVPPGRTPDRMADPRAEGDSARRPSRTPPVRFLPQPLHGGAEARARSSPTTRLPSQTSDRVRPGSRMTRSTARFGTGCLRSHPSHRPAIGDALTHGPDPGQARVARRLRFDKQSVHSAAKLRGNLPNIRAARSLNRSGFTRRPLLPRAYLPRNQMRGRSLSLSTAAGLDDPADEHCVVPGLDRLLDLAFAHCNPASLGTSHRLVLKNDTHAARSRSTASIVAVKRLREPPLR